MGTGDQFQQKSFSVHLGNRAYSSNWDRIFGEKEEVEELGDESCSLPNCELCADAKTPYSYEVALKKVEEEAAKDEHEPLTLPAVQRRMKEWAEYNFPLKVTPEHRRIAQEFFNASERKSAVEIVTSLAYLLAAREGRNHRPLIGAVEEIGELCHAHLKNEQGIRGTPEEHRSAKMDAIGDTLIYLLDYCNKEGFCMEECLELAMEETSSRDWIRFPKNGKTE